MHALDMTDNRANMAYIGETPWHGLGAKLEENESIEHWIGKAGLGWTIKTAPAQFTIDDEIHEFENQQVLYRSDTLLPLSIMSGSRYNIVQPSEVIEFYRDLVGITGEFQLETAGSLYGGRKIWALAKYKTHLQIGGNDLIKPYLMLATSCDGTLSTTGMFTTVRVVCSNTLRAALGKDMNTGVKVPHSRKFNAQEVQKALSVAKETFESFKDDADRLAGVKVDDKLAAELLVKTYARTDKKLNVLNEKFIEKVVHDCLNIFHNGPGAQLETAKFTAWGLVNTVTNYEDFHRRAIDRDSRFRSAQFGDGLARKQKIVELVNEI